MRSSGRCRYHHTGCRQPGTMAQIVVAAMWWCCLVLVIPPAVNAQCPCNESNYDIIVSMFETLGGTVPPGGKSICDFAGVTCRDRDVSKITLRNLNLTGNASAFDFSNMSTVTSLELSNNPQLTGSLELLQLPPLVTTFIATNTALSGTLPDVWSSSYTSLRYVDVSSTNIAGTLPSWSGFSTLAAFSVLASNNAGITGSLPASWGSLKLKTLDLGNTNLSGSIPSSWGDVSSAMTNSVNTINLCNCGLSGALPSSWMDGTFSNLNSLNVSKNSLTGQFSVLNNPAMSLLDISHNNISGELPATFLQSSNALMTTLDASFNSISGTLSAGMPATLKWLSLSHNNIGGSLPSTWYCPVLTWLDVSSNRLTGSFPATLNLAAVTFIDLSNNKISGPLPANWDAILASLMTLNVSYNRCTLPMPLWSKMNTLGVLDMSHNELSGSFSVVPASNALQTLNVSWNNISSLSASALSSAFTVTTLDASHNRISVFPSALPPTIVFLSMSSNVLSGSLTEQWTTYTSLQVVDVSVNNISGSLPMSWSSMEKLSMLLINNNTLTGGLATSWCERFLERGFVLDVLFQQQNLTMKNGTTIAVVDTVTFGQWTKTWCVSYSGSEVVSASNTKSHSLSSAVSMSINSDSISLSGVRRTKSLSVTISPTLSQRYTPPASTSRSPARSESASTSGSRLQSSATSTWTHSPGRHKTRTKGQRSPSATSSVTASAFTASHVTPSVTPRLSMSSTRRKVYTIGRAHTQSSYSWTSSPGYSSTDNPLARNSTITGITSSTVTPSVTQLAVPSVPRNGSHSVKKTHARALSSSSRTCSHSDSLGHRPLARNTRSIHIGATASMHLSHSFVTLGGTSTLGSSFSQIARPSYSDALSHTGSMITFTSRMQKGLSDSVLPTSSGDTRRPSPSLSISVSPTRTDSASVPCEEYSVKECRIAPLDVFSAFEVGELSMVSTWNRPFGLANVSTIASDWGTITSVSVEQPYTLKATLAVPNMMPTTFSADIEIHVKIGITYTEVNRICTSHAIVQITLQSTDLPSSPTVRDVAQITSIAVAGPLLGASAPIIQQSLLQLSLSACLYSNTATLPVSENPTQLTVGYIVNASLRGCVIGNIILLVGCMLLGSAVSLVHCRMTKQTSVLHSLSIFGLPGKYFILVGLLFQPTVSSATAIIIHTVAWYDVLIGLCGIVVLWGVVLIYLRRVMQLVSCAVLVVQEPVDLLDWLVGRLVAFVPPSREDGDSAGMTSRSVPATIPKDEDCSGVAPNDVLEEELQWSLKRYDTLLGRMIQGREWFFGVDFLLSTYFGVVGGLRPTTTEGCKNASIAFCAGCILRLVILIALRPFVSKAYAALQWILAGLAVVSSCLGLLRLPTGSDIIVFIQIGLVALRGILQTINFLRMRIEFTKKEDVREGSGLWMLDRAMTHQDAIEKYITAEELLDSTDTGETALELDSLWLTATATDDDGVGGSRTVLEHETADTAVVRNPDDQRKREIPMSWTTEELIQRVCCSNASYLDEKTNSILCLPAGDVSQRRRLMLLILFACGRDSVSS